MILVYSGFGRAYGPDISPVETYVPTPFMEYDGDQYQELDTGLPPSTQAMIPQHSGQLLSVVGVTLAFFSTLMFVTNLLLAGSRGR